MGYWFNEIYGMVAADRRPFLKAEEIWTKSNAVMAPGDQKNF